MSGMPLAEAITSRVLEAIEGALRLEGNKYDDFTEEYETFHDAADALLDVLDLLELQAKA